MKKAAAYARVSGQKQSVNGNSIPVLLARKKPRGEKTTGTAPVENAFLLENSGNSR